MSKKSDSSEYSSFSERTNRSGKSLTEKIRDLGFDFPIKRPYVRQSLQYVDLKMEDNRASNYSILLPNLNMEQIVYFQPEISYDATDPGRQVYTIGKLDAESTSSREIRRISDITVISYRPTKSIKYRKKKRISTMTTKIEEILNKHKGPMPIREPSEESINILPKIEERQKNINDLPENVLQKIFMYFDMKERNLVLSRVSKSWYYILKDPMFWTELHLQGENIEKETIIGLISRHPQLKVLRMTSVRDVVDILQELCRRNQGITNLGVRHCIVSPNNFARIILHVISCCKNLEILDIKGMRFQSDSFYLELGRLKNLRSLNLTGNKLLRSQDLITLSVNCRSLEELKILDLSLENGKGFPLRDEHLTFTLSHLETKLTCLKIDMLQLRNVSYQAILQCPNLTHLALKNCLLLSGDMFRQFPILKKLKKLKITRGVNLKPEDFQFVFEHESMTEIEDLDINGCWRVGETGLETITGRLPFLKSLSLKNCKSIKGPHLVHFSKCPDLVYLNLAHTEVQYSYLPTLYVHANALRTLVIDQQMLTKTTIRQLQNFFPSLQIIVSYSEFKKDERPLTKSTKSDLGI